MGKMKGAAERRGDEAPALSRAGGRAGGTVQPPLPRVKGVFLWCLEGENRVSVFLDSGLFIDIFTSSVITCAPQREASLSNPIY